MHYVEHVCVHVWLDDGSSAFVHMSSAVGIVALHTTPNSYALTKMFNKIKNCIYLCFICIYIICMYSLHPTPLGNGTVVFDLLSQTGLNFQAFVGFRAETTNSMR